MSSGVSRKLTGGPKHDQFMMGRIFSALSGNISGVLPDDYFTHYMHCVDYIRQSVMCSGDSKASPGYNFDPFRLATSPESAVCYAAGLKTSLGYLVS